MIKKFLYILLDNLKQNEIYSSNYQIDYLKEFGKIKNFKDKKIN